MKSVYGYDKLATPDMDIYLAGAAATLAYHPTGTIKDIPKLLLDSKFRERVLKRVTNTGLRDMWHDLLRPHAGEREVPSNQKYIKQNLRPYH